MEYKEPLQTIIHFNVTGCCTILNIKVAGLGPHLLKDGFLQEELAIAPAVAPFLLFLEQIVAFEKGVGYFCDDGGKDLVHSQ